jgi:hypothetical protein
MSMKLKSSIVQYWQRRILTIVRIVDIFSFCYCLSKLRKTYVEEMKDELEERMAEIKKTAQKVRQKLKGKTLYLLWKTKLAQIEDKMEKIDDQRFFFDENI